jgi:biopolymer transport protein ExbB/TolQ
MSFKEKVINFFKSAYTYIILVVIGLAILVCFMFFKEKKAYELIELLNSRLKAREQELENLKKIELEQQKKQQEIETRYQAMLQELKEKHAVEIEKISEQKKQELRAIIEQYKENPEEQSRHLSELFGLEISS